jgi:hypothetical protein
MRLKYNTITRDLNNQIRAKKLFYQTVFKDVAAMTRLVEGHSLIEVFRSWKNGEIANNRLEIGI